MAFEACDFLGKMSVFKRIRLIFHLLIIIFRIQVLTVLVLLRNMFYVLITKPRRSIKDQVALVTGGGNGLGRAIVLKLASEGCHIAVADIDGNAASKVAKEAMEFGIKAVGYNVDVSDPKKVSELKTQIEEDIDSVDILINNAGLVPQLSLHNGPAEHIARIVDVNFTSHIWTLRTFLPDMKTRRRGHIVTISSMMAHFPFASTITYSTTKAAALALLKGVEEEIKLEGLTDYIPTTYVYPYFVATRRDMCEVLDFSVPPISPDYCADKIVEGILVNKREIYIPGYFYYATQIMSILPNETCNLVRDYIIREKECVKFNFLSSDVRNEETIQSGDA